MKLKRIESAVNNSRRFWHEIKNITGKPKCEPDISLEAWYTHFSRLFQTGYNADGDVRDDINEVELDDVQKQLFDSPITDDEITDSIQRLNVNKASAGNIMPQHLIYGMRVLYHYKKSIKPTVY